MSAYERMTQEKCNRNTFIIVSYSCLLVLFAHFSPCSILDMHLFDSSIALSICVINRFSFIAFAFLRIGCLWYISRLLTRTFSPPTRILFLSPILHAFHFCCTYSKIGATPHHLSSSQHLSHAFNNRKHKSLHGNKYSKRQKNHSLN